MLLKKFFSAYFLKKKKLIVESVSWDNFLTLLTPLYLFTYGWIFNKLGLWDDLPEDLRRDILTSGSMWVIISYLTIVFVSRIITDAGIYMWKRRNDE